MLSRVADSLYWMARYGERAEHTARLVAVKLEATVEQSNEEADASWLRVHLALTGEPLTTKTPDAFQMTRDIAFDRLNPSSLISSLRLARDNARQVREQLSNELWEHLNRLYLQLQTVTIDNVWVHQPAQFFREVLEQLYTLDGIMYTTLRHGEGWYFLQLGRFIERAQLVSRLLDIHYGGGLPAPAQALRPKDSDWLVLLKLCTAFEPYSHEYTAAIHPARVAQFLLFDAEFPHSVRFAIDRVRDALDHVAPGAPPARRAHVERLAGRLKAAVDFGQIGDFSEDSLAAFLANIAQQCEQIHNAVYAAYIGYDAEAVL